MVRVIILLFLFSFNAFSVEFNLIDGNIQLDTLRYLDEQSGNSGAEDVISHIAFMAIEGEVEDIEDFMNLVLAENDELRDLEYSIEKIQVEGAFVNFIKLTKGNVSLEQMLSFKRRYYEYKVVHHLLSPLENNLLSDWILVVDHNETISQHIAGEVGLEFNLEQGSKEARVFGLKFNDGLEADLIDDVRFFVSANDDWMSAPNDDLRTSMFDNEIMKPLNTQTEIGVRERSRTYSIRNAFIVQPHQSFSIQNPTGFSVDYRGLYLYFSQEF